MFDLRRREFITLLGGAAVNVAGRCARAAGGDAGACILRKCIAS